MSKTWPGVEQVSEKGHDLGGCVKRACNTSPRFALSKSSDVLDTADEVPLHRETWNSILLYSVADFPGKVLWEYKVTGIWKSLWECFWSWDRRVAALWVTAYLLSEWISLLVCDYMGSSFEILQSYWKEVLTRAILNYKEGTRSRILYMDLSRYAVLWWWWFCLFTLYLRNVL